MKWIIKHLPVRLRTILTQSKLAHRLAELYFGVPSMKKKRELLCETAKINGLNVFVETGTYLGDTVLALCGVVDQIYSVELCHEYAIKAKERFAGDNRVTIIEGDAGKVMPMILRELKQPALFWLDGHRNGWTPPSSAETPIIDELKAILDAPDPGHVILIDDARLFGWVAGYPTIRHVVDFVHSKRDVEVVIKDDIIRIGLP